LVPNSGWFCPFVQRAWIALELKGIPYQYKEENPYHKDKEFLAINPKGLVPAVKYQSKALYESIVLLEFFEDAFPKTEPLLPSDPYERAQVRLMVDHISKNVVSNFFKLIQSQEKEGQDSAREDLYKALRHFSETLKGPYWAGDKITHADIALIPFVARLYIPEKHRGLDRNQVDKKFADWCKRVLDLEVVKNTSSEPDHYEEIYGRYLRDEAQSEAAKATRSGKAIP